MWVQLTLVESQVGICWYTLSKTRNIHPKGDNNIMIWKKNN